ncbi:hypothetical protein ACFOWM_01005 [Ferruginibacter yonginensis]|uniref:Membrane protein involved in the export of O-antigen and teichoic acid n=1 Tax=Ferruginibacter yonginensis TaxID=1310416 RepID=A0ABV8QNX2_9BACT
MTIKQALLHNTGWKMVAMLFTFLNNLFIVKLLGITQSASLFYAIAIFTFLGTIFKGSLENGIIFYASQNPASKKLLLQLVGVVTVVQIILVYVVLKYFISVAANFQIALATIFIVSNITLFYITSFFQVAKMFLSVNLISCVFTFLQTILLIVCLFKLPLGFAISPDQNIVLGILAITSLLQVLTLLFYYVNKVPFENSTTQSITSLQKVVTFSLTNYVCAILLFLIMRADLYFVEKYCDTNTLSNYIQASKIGQLLLVFPGLLGGVIFPYAATDDQTLQPKINGLIRLITLVFLIGFVMSYFVGNTVFTWLLGDGFGLMNHIFLLSFIGIYSLTISILLISFYEGVNKQRIIIIANSCTLLILLLGDYFLVKKYGFALAAIIFSVSNFIGLCILLNEYKKMNSLHFIHLFLITKQDVIDLQFWKKI